MTDVRLDFRVAVLATDGRCLVHDDPADCEGPPRAHHVVYQQTLRRAGRDDLLWDPLNGMTVCDRAHERHHSGAARIPVSAIPSRCADFAREHGFLSVLERLYAPDAR